MIAAYSLFDTIGIRTIGPELEYATFVYVSWLMIFPAIPILVVAFAVRRGEIISHIRANAVKGIGGGTIALGSYALIIFAFANAPVASVAALRETGVVFAALIGTFALGEHLGRRRIPAAILVAVGAGALKFTS